MTRLLCVLLHWPYWRVCATRDRDHGYLIDSVTECPRCGNRWFCRRWGF